ncbi:UNKNOWN [Stylonychia lemnae]|uniref:Uncharacterized protein n=1 Tax=Stylonychia lemnae TaxID=5949 RepID=A0A078A868_STYLE|nr:UNKNOWN [Stylonychia lemnae]|eukprot:CDW78414.1 UNKNOWN [Stylonychia lemnae]
MAEDQKKLLAQAFPIEADLNIFQSGVKQVGRTEILANDTNFLNKFYQFIEDSNYMRINNLPTDIKIAIQLLLCERSYLIQLVKGLIMKILPRDKPKIYNDPFLESEFLKLDKKRDLTPQNEPARINDASNKTFQSPINNKQRNVNQKRQPNLHQNDNNHQQQNMVIEDLVIGATNLIGALGKKLISPSSLTRLNQLKGQNLDRIQNHDNRVVYLRIPPSDEKTATQNQNKSPALTSNRNIINQFDNMFMRKEEVLLKIDTQSDDDESVDVPSSSSSDEKANRVDNKNKIQTQKMPIKGVANIVQNKINPSGNSKNHHSSKSTTNNNVNFKQTANDSNFNTNNFNNNIQTKRGNNPLQLITPQMNYTNQQDTSQISHITQNHSKQPSHNSKKSVSQNRYQNNNIEESDDQEEIKQQPLKYGSVINQTNDQNDYFQIEQNKNLVPIEDFIKMLQSTETARQSKMHISQLNNRVDDSQSTVMKQSDNFPRGMSMVKGSIANVNKSGIRMKDTFSKLHRDFSIGSSDSDNDKDNSALDPEERNRRRSIGIKMLMSRESSFGVVGFKSEDYTMNQSSNQNNSTNQKSLADDSDYNNQLQQINQQRRKYGVDPDSEDDYQDIKFKVKKRKDNNNNQTNANTNINANSNIPKTSSKGINGFNNMQSSVSHMKQITKPNNIDDEYYSNSNGKEKNKNTIRMSKHVQSTNDSQANSSSRRGDQNNNSMFKSEFDLKQLQNINKNKNINRNYLNGSQAQSTNRSVKWGDNIFS